MRIACYESPGFFFKNGVSYIFSIAFPHTTKPQSSVAFYSGRCHRENGDPVLTVSGILQVSFAKWQATLHRASLWAVPELAMGVCPLEPRHVNDVRIRTICSTDIPSKTYDFTRTLSCTCISVCISIYPLLIYQPEGLWLFYKTDRVEKGNRKIFMRKRNYTVTIRMNKAEYDLLQSKVKESGQTSRQLYSMRYQDLKIAFAE